MRRRGALAPLLSLIDGLEAVAFMIAAVLHVGVPLPVGFDEPVILPAAIAEGLIGLFLTIAALALVAGDRLGWSLAVAAHVFGWRVSSLGWSRSRSAPGRAPRPTRSTTGSR